ncbi:unnamed protein product [Caenorhabditis nigoni]
MMMSINVPIHQGEVDSQERSWLSAQTSKRVGRKLQMHTPSLVAYVLLLLLPSISLASEATVHVRGRLMCNGKPYANETIELYEKNWALLDRRLVVAKTDADGNFDMNSLMNEWKWFTPTPYIYFGNYCDINNDLGSFQCADAIKIYVPKYFVHEGKYLKQPYDLGEIEMMGLNSEKKGLEKLVYTISIFTQQDCRDVPSK